MRLEAGRRVLANEAVVGVRSRREAIRIFSVATGVVVLEAAATLVPNEIDRGLLELVRITARTSLVWFALAFVAAPLVALRPSPATKWLLRNRRAIGLAMALSHGVHLVAILALAGRHGDAFWGALASTTLIGGSLGYVMLAAMAATSSDRAVAWLGRRRWRTLHRAGMWFLWSIFAFSYAGQLGQDRFAAVASSLLVALAAARAWSVVRRATRRRARSVA